MKKNYFRLMTLSLGLAVSFTVFAQTDAELSTKTFTADERATILKEANPGDNVSGGNQEILAATCTNVLSTPVLGGNSFNGTMFDVTAANDLTVETFSVTVDITTNIAIYARTGSYVGNESSSAGWTFLDSAIVVGAGTGTVVEVPVDVNYAMLSGSTHAFYVTATDANASFDYTNGTTVGTLLASDANISVFEGNGGEWPFSVTFSPRVFNGDIIYCLPTGVNDVLTQNNISIYPNPASDELNISLPSLNGVSADVSIYNVIGEVVFIEQIIANGSTNKFDISNLNSGVYFVKVVADGDEYSTKLFVD